MFIEEIKQHTNFVFAAVKGNYGEEIIPLYNYVIIVEVPKGIRLERVRNRSYQKFGERMLPGGDLHEQEEAFFRMIESREDDYVENWLKTLSCPIIRIDGTKSVDENVEELVRLIKF